MPVPRRRQPAPSARRRAGVVAASAVAVLAAGVVASGPALASPARWHHSGSWTPTATATATATPTASSSSTSSSMSAAMVHETPEPGTTTTSTRAVGTSMTDLLLADTPTTGVPMADVSMAGMSMAGTSMAGMPGMSAPQPGRWVPLDEAAQAAATEAFFARTPAPVPATGAVMVPEFHATCTVSHHGTDDPVVFPGQAGASHDHTFIGNDSTDADSTHSSLRAATTTCDPATDKSAYWIPTLYDDGTAVDPEDITVYYGSDVADTTKVQPFPAGLKMLTGDARNQTELAQGNFWCSGPSTGRTPDAVFPICGEDSNLIRQVSFPQCWDGVHLDSPDHEAHMSQTQDGSCPADHPVPVPALSYVLRYPEALGHDPSGITLASGTTYSMHADFFDGWDPDELAQRVRDCLNQHVKCGANGEV